MNKLLLASTALVASATFAMAEVDLSGSAEMGVFGGETFGEDQDLQFHTDIDVTFTMSGETDQGLTFGASIDLDESDDGDAFDNSKQGGETIFISGDWGTLTMGDTDGALDWAMDEAIIGASLIDDNEHLGYNGNSQLDGLYDGQIARYDYSFGDFGVAVSFEISDDESDVTIDDDGNIVLNDNVIADSDFDQSDNRDPVWGIGFKYATEFNGWDMGFGLGYQSGSADDVLVDTDADIIDGEYTVTRRYYGDVDPEAWGISMSLGMDNGFQAIVNYSDYDELYQTKVGDFDFTGDGDNSLEVGAQELDKHYGIAMGYEFGELLVAANYGKFDYDNAESRGWGLIMNYDLGGGASLQAGYSNSKVEVDGLDAEDFGLDDDSVETYSFGISMAF
ncbi:porin [Palleronia caenipelagi]|nr:porin [Palleronia caenipelagi]